MSDHSAIAWTDATWNPVTGCSKVSPGCAHCYAEALSLRWGWAYARWTPANAEANVVLHPERLDQPLHWRKPRRVFVASMGDLFHEQVPSSFVTQVFVTMRRANWHEYQILTKRPERMAEHMRLVIKPLQNAWLGSSIENDRYVDRADALRETPAAVRFISAEPLLGPLPSLDLRGIDWLIIGGESGPGYRPMDAAWVHDLVDRADAAGIPVFVKQDSGPWPGQQYSLCDDLWARKEWPR